MSSTRLTFYDTSRAYYASYYLNGFNELKNSRKLKVRILNALPMRLKSAIQDPKWQHLLFAMALFKLEQGDRAWYFCIDTHDANAVNSANNTGGYHLPLLQCVDAYFKVNYNPEEIERTVALKVFQKKIDSIAQFFPIRSSLIFSLSRRLALPPTLFGFKPGSGYNRPYGGYLLDARRRLLDFKDLQSFDKIIAHRDARKDIDIFYITSFRRGQRHRTAMERRYQVMQRLARTSSLSTVMGFASSHKLPDKYASASLRRLNQQEYLETLARAKVAIYTQGIAGCISSKFSLAMALGCTMIGEPLVNNPGLIATNPHLREQFAYTDPDELAAHAIKLVTQPEEVRKLGALNAAMFDSQLAPRAAAEYILDTLRSY